VVATLAVSALIATGCGGGGGGDETGPSASLEERRKMPSCGTYDVPLGELPPEGRVARDCFLSAFREGREAELAVTVTSFEGDPITTVYRVLGRDDLEVFVDASADRFSGPVKVTHNRCTSVVEEGPVLAPGGCTPLSGR